MSQGAGWGLNAINSPGTVSRLRALRGLTQIGGARLKGWGGSEGVPVPVGSRTRSRSGSGRATWAPNKKQQIANNERGSVDGQR